MSKFNIGDIVVANDKSNSCYSLTNKENGFVGKVISVQIGKDTEDIIEIEVIKICKELEHHIPGEFWVRSSCFDLLKAQEEYHVGQETEHLISLNEVIELIEDDEMLSNKAKRHIIKKIKDL